MDTAVVHALPAPTDTPYRSPPAAMSTLSPEYENMSLSTTPPPLVHDDRTLHRRSRDSINPALDESISPLDPRRFTPTLHASLVSEILSLRRDLENRTKDIDRLEHSLHQSLTQNDTLSKSLTESNKDVRSVKRQMQLLEGGTLSAITDLSKERDGALEEVSDLRKRLEQAQKRVKTHGENADRTQELWDKDKQAWAAEKRALETKVHVVEGRLKVVLSEVANAQLAPMSVEPLLEHAQGRTSVPGSPIKRPLSGQHHRRQSATSITSDQAGGRTSALGFANAASVNLADELALEDINEAASIDIDEDDGRISPDALPEERGRPASSLSIKARKVLGLAFDFEDLEFGDRAHMPADLLSGKDTMPKSILKKPMYIDSAVQYSRPGTPIQESHDAPVAGEDIKKTSIETTSSASQTIDSLPSPPASPRQNDAFLATIPESAWEKVETKEISTQTDAPPVPDSPSQYMPSRADTGDLQIPTIAIIPPTSRSTTPNTTTVLPANTKNASCQADPMVLLKYTSVAIQTEEIRIDRRDMLTPQLMPGALVSSQMQAAVSKNKSAGHIRKPQQPTSNSALKRSAPPVPPIPSNVSQMIEDKMNGEKFTQTISSDNHPGTSDRKASIDTEIDDDVFEDDDVFNRPTAKFTLRSGKMVSQHRSLEDIGEIAAINAGEALALETLRQTENSLAPEMRGQADSLSRAKGLQRTTTIRRGQSSAARSNSTNMRKAAMISSGTAAHNHQQRPSLSTNGSSESSVAPPITIPLRYSSARLGKSFSEGGRSSRGSSNASPTRQGRRVAKPPLRKARSGPALSPAAAARRQRSRSPPIDARVSIVPDMPMFHMPHRSHITNPVSLVNTPQDAAAPRPSVATGPSRQGQHAKTNSDAPLMQQNSVVEAIAQTMVGEWMYKYVRRRKSFGKPDKDWDPNKSADELINNPGSAGVRHKRWVWVAPYERAVMWSNKQPMNGTALMGKNGRKLTIKSVLDVKDENPMPKNSLTGPSFNRSILILTPQRALKFTVTSQERHYVWLTALSFLSHSPLNVGDLAALAPPADDFSQQEVSASLVPSLQKRKIRDSIRLAKGSSRSIIDHSNFLPDITIEGDPYYDPKDLADSSLDAAVDAAVPPVIRRYHSRRRSNTVPKAPPSSFKTLAALRDHSSSTSSYSQSVGTTTGGSSDRGPYTPSLGNPSMPSTRRGSEASALGRPPPGNFYNFESNSSHNAMTMRMDAFIDNKQAGKGGYRNLKITSQSGSNVRSGLVKKDLSYWGFDENGLSSLSPDDTVTSVDPNFRYSESTGRGSIERDYFRNF